MKAGDRVLLFLTSAGMELAYLYACTTFVVTAIFHQTFPFTEAVLSFLTAALLAHIAEGRGWRVIYVLSLQTLGFLPLLWRMSVVFGSWSNSILSQHWVADYFSNPADAVGYSVFVLVLAWVLVFWASGAEFAARARDYSIICARFDRGLIVFFALFLTRYYLQSIQGVLVEESLSGYFVFPFLVFGLLAIGLARNANTSRRDFLPGYQTLGTLLSFVIILLSASAGLGFFLLPSLTAAAEKGNDVFSLATQPLVSLLYGGLIWLFGTDFSSNNIPTPSEPSPAVSVQWSFPWWVELVAQVLAWGVAILVLLVLLAMIFGFLFAVFAWLAGKTPMRQNRKGLVQALSEITHQIGLVLSFWRALWPYSEGYRGARQLYAALLIWGQNSGLPHVRVETPSEYGARLKLRFPVLAREIERVVGAYHREVYGESVLSSVQLDSARTAWHELASPSHWSLRFRSLFNRPSLS